MTHLFRTLLNRFFLAAAAAVTSIVTARLLGPEGRGVYFAAITMTGIGVQVACLGVQSSNVYLVASNPGRMASLHAHSILLSMALVPPLAAIAWAMWIFGRLPLDDPWLIVLALLGVPPALYYLLGVNLLLGTGRVPLFNRYETLARLVPLLLIGMSAWHATPRAFLFATVTASWVVALVLLRTLTGNAKPALVLDRDLLKSSLAYGLRAWFAALLGFVLSRFAVLFLNHMGASAELGFFSVAMQVGELLAILPATAGMLLFPRLVQDRERRDVTTLQTLKGIGLVMALICILAGILAGIILPWLFGAAFTPAVPVLRWFLPGCFLLALISILSQYLAAVGIPWLLVGSWMLGVAVVAAACAIMVPRYGAQGGAMSLSLAYLVVFVLLLLLSLWQQQTERIGRPVCE